MRLSWSEDISKYISHAGVRMMFGTGLDVIHSYVLDAVAACRLLNGGHSIESVVVFEEVAIAMRVDSFLFSC